MLYEVINPSDKVTFHASDHKVACVAVLFIGEGHYAVKCLDEQADIPGFQALGDKDLSKTVAWLGLDPGTFIRTNRTSIVEAMRSFAYGSENERRLYEEALRLLEDPEKRKQLMAAHEARNRSGRSWSARRPNCAELRALGAEAGSDGDGMGMWIGPNSPDEGRLRADTLADLSPEGWEEVKRRVVEVNERNKENLRQMALEDERSAILRTLAHHRYDGDMVWTCGDLSLTDQQLRTMTPSEWEIELAAFREEDERLSIEVVTPAPALTEERIDHTHPDWQDGSHLTLDQLKDEVGVPKMEAVHVAPAPVVQQPVDVELTVEAQTLIQDARFHAARQNSAAYVLSAGDGQFLAFGTADQIREMLKEQ